MCVLYQEFIWLNLFFFFFFFIIIIIIIIFFFFFGQGYKFGLKFKHNFLHQHFFP